MDPADEIVHLLTQIGHNAYGDIRAVVFGYIIDYDPATHTARALLPQFAVVDPSSGVITEQAQTPWIPLGTIGLGSQWAPKKGQQCYVIMTERGTGPGTIVCVTHDDIHPVADDGLEEGESIFKHMDSGTYFKFFKDGSLNFVYQNDAKQTVDKDGNVNITTHDGKAIDMPAEGDMTLTGPEGGAGSATIILGVDGTVTILPAAGQQVKLGG